MLSREDHWVDLACDILRAVGGISAWLARIGVVSGSQKLCDGDKCRMGEQQKQGKSVFFFILRIINQLTKN